MISNRESHSPLPSLRLPHRVLCLQHSSVFENYGGVEYYLDDTLRLATDICGGANVRTLIPQRGDGLKTSPRPYTYQLVPWATQPIVKKLCNRIPWPLFNAARKAIEEFRPQILLNAHVSLGPVAFALSKLYSIPVVTIVYGIDAWGNLWPQDELALKKSNRILSISHWTKNVLVDRGYPATQIDILHPMLNPTFQNRPLPTKTTRDRFTLLTISRLSAAEQYKGQDHVLQALGRLKEKHSRIKFRYIIQGKGDDQPRLESLVHSLDLNEIVEFRDAVPDRDGLESLYNEADVYVMPSRYGYWGRKWRGEGFGIVYCEAAAFGVPSIAYRCGGATDIIRHGETGLLITPDNIDELASGIWSLYENFATREAMGKKAYHHVLKHFTESATREQLFQALGKHPA
jgi:glycosyltransferase involved in cell wall biosynthesis